MAKPPHLSPYHAICVHHCTRQSPKLWDVTLVRESRLETGSTRVVTVGPGGKQMMAVGNNLSTDSAKFLSFDVLVCMIISDDFGIGE